MSIAGNDVLISYDGQPPTCYRCNDPGRVQIECPRRKRLDKVASDTRSTWADIVSNNTRDPHQHRSFNQTVNETEDRRGNNSRTKNENTTLITGGQEKTCTRRYWTGQSNDHRKTPNSRQREPSHGHTGVMEQGRELTHRISQYMKRETRLSRQSDRRNENRKDAT